MGGSPNICACGCLRPCGDQLLVNHHYGKTTRKQPQDYRIEDRGYKTPCWVWNLGINKWGYGKVKHEGKTCAAHRYYYEQFVGPIPATLDGERAELDHLCRVRRCVNPEHAELVTQSENIRRGELGALTTEQAQSIPVLYSEGKSQRIIGEMLGVGQVQVSRILNGLRRSRLGIKVECRRDRNLKISSEQADEIRKRVRAGETQRAVAKSVGLGQSQISRIVRGESWQTAMVA
jgi:predicted transcriptional regulator